jgi:hypothetical protein
LKKVTPIAGVHQKKVTPAAGNGRKKGDVACGSGRLGYRSWIVGGMPLKKF